MKNVVRKGLMVAAIAVMTTGVTGIASAHSNDQLERISGVQPPAWIQVKVNAVSTADVLGVKPDELNGSAQICTSPVEMFHQH